VASQIARSNTRVHHPLRYLGSVSIHVVLIGVAGGQVLGWTDLDNEIKTAKLKNVSGNASFVALRLLIAQNRNSLRSCTTTVLILEDSADPPCAASSMRRCILIGEPVSRSVELQFRDFSTRMVSQPIAGVISRHRSILNPINHRVYRDSLLVKPCSCTLTPPCLVRLNYTHQTYNNPQENWLYVSVVVICSIWMTC